MSKSISIQELIDNRKSYLQNIPKIEGTYKVYMPEGFQMIIRDKSDAGQCSENETYTKDELIAKWKHICQYDEADNNVLYIAQSCNLRRRIGELIRYATGKDNKHTGERAIWQIENNKELLIEYTVETNSVEKKKQYIKDYQSRHGGEKPFANRI
jgi:hypothetical protein